MLHKTLLLFTLVFLSGCVERGFNLTVNQTIHTVTAIKIVDTRDIKNVNTQKDIEKMNTAVLEEQKQRNQKKLKKRKKEKHTEVKQLESIKQLKIENEHAKVAQKEHDTLLEKQRFEEEKQHLHAEKERKTLEDKARVEKIEQENQEKILQAINETKEKDALEKKLALDEVKRIRKNKETKIALEHKIAEERKRQIEKEMLEKKLVKQKLLEDKKLALDEKNRIHAEEQRQAAKIAEKKKQPLLNTESLLFHQSKQTYQKFGTSEIHGHVVYLTPSDQEIALKNTKVYLVPKNIKVDYWYDNYYLKNKESDSSMSMTVSYINATHLNLEKNFAFYGLATGTYYIIIESTYPSSIAKNKKAYIAKKITVEKYKKIMTVFSKKL